MIPPMRGAGLWLGQTKGAMTDRGSTLRHLIGARLHFRTVLFSACEKARASTPARSPHARRDRILQRDVRSRTSLHHKPISRDPRRTQSGS